MVHKAGGAQDSLWMAFNMRRAAAGLLAVSIQTAAQDVPLEEIVVTGSRIARPDFESASPIVSVAPEAFVRTGATNVDAVLNRLPQFVPDVTNSSNNPANGGQGNLQLRGLGATRTLVLLNGRRLVPANGNGVVDVNVIPSSLIESVEVITGGASAVYGSDAIAGVVNFKLKQEFSGLQFDGSGGVTDQGDGNEYSAGLTGGLEFAGGRGDVFGYVGYSEREAITYDQRTFSRYALGYFGPGAGGVGPDGAFLPLGSQTIEEGRPSGLRASTAAFDSLFASYGFPSGTVPFQTAFGMNQDGSLFTMGNGEPGSVVNFRGKRDPLLFNDRNYTYNFAPYNYLLLPLERVSGYAGARFDLGAGHEVYGQALYSDYSAEQALAPTPSNQIFVPVTNPYIPPDLRFLLDSRTNPNADLRTAKRFSEIGPRVVSNDYDVYQVTAGVRGPWLEDWNYDLYAQYGENEQREQQAGNILRSRVNELTYAPDGGASICGEFNLFRIGSMSPECTQYISASGVNHAGYEQAVVELSANGPLASLPAGDIQVAVGVMHKRDDYFYRADPIASVILSDGLPDIGGFNASDDIDGSDDNTDVYVEALLPLLAGLTGVEGLDLVLGYRRSEYDSAGGVDAWKAELLYQPVPSLRMRGSLQRAVRAPSVFELYQPRLPLIYGNAPPPFGVLDPCEAGSDERSGPNSAQVESLCLAQGVPAALLPTFQDADLEHRGVSGGNPDLEPETGDTLTVGLVWTSAESHRLLSGLQISVDWYRIEMEDSIEQVIGFEYVPRCFDARTNPTFDPSNLWCGYFSRDPASGEMRDLLDILTNLEGFELSGVDLQVDWNVEAGPGVVSLNLLASWLDTYTIVPPPGLPEEDQAGLVGLFSGGSYPEWKWMVNLRYEWQALTLGAGWRYVDAMLNRDPPGFDWNYRVPSQDYLDLFAGHVFEAGALDGLTLRVGVENLTDETPPLVPSAIQANTDASQYDVLGRRYFLNLSYRF